MYSNAYAHVYAYMFSHVRLRKDAYACTCARLHVGERVLMYTSTPFARMYNSRSTHALARTHEHTQNIFTHSPTYTHAPTLSLSLTGTSRRMAQLCPPGRHTAPYPASLRRPHPRRTTANTRRSRDKVSGGRWARGSRGDGDHGGALERILRARSGFSGWISGCVARTVSVSLSRSLCMYISKSCAQHGLSHIHTHPHTHTRTHTQVTENTSRGMWKCGAAGRPRAPGRCQSMIRHDTTAVTYPADANYVVVAQQQPAGTMIALQDDLQRFTDTGAVAPSWVCVRNIFQIAGVVLLSCLCWGAS